MSILRGINSSLAYEILMYLNGFYIGLFIVCEVAIGLLKVCNMTYPENTIMADAGVLTLICVVDIIRIILGSKGDLDYFRLPIYISILLMIPSSFGVCYFVIYQTYILRLEYIWCAVMLLFQALELTFAVLCMITMCNTRQYA